MQSFLKGLAGAGVVTLMAVSGPAFAQDAPAAPETPAEAAPAPEAPAEEPSAPAPDAPEDAAGAGSDAVEGAQEDAQQNPADPAAPVAPTPEVQAMIDGLPETVDSYFWCASAFSLLASVSENPAETQGLTGLAQTLIASARDELAEDEYPTEDFDAISSGYNLIVLSQFESDDESAMTYSPDDCLTAANVTAEPPAGGAPAAPLPVPGDAPPLDGPAESPMVEDPAEEPADAPAEEPADDADPADPAADEAAPEAEEPAAQ